MKRQILSLATAMGLAALAGSAIAQDFDSSAEVVMPSTAITYEAINEAIKFGTAWGDRSTGAHGTFGAFIADFVTPFHTHSAAYHGVVLEGTMTNPFESEDSPPEMGPGSYWYVPAGSVHATACISETPCRFFFTAEGPFDFDLHE